LATCVTIIAQAGFDASWTNLLVQSTFAHHPDVLLQYSKLTTLAEFYTSFHKYTNPTGTAFQVGDISINDKASIAPLVEKLCPIIEGLFVRPWTSFIAANDAYAQALQVQEFVDTTLKDSVTKETAMDVKETANDGVELNQAIAAATRQKTEHLQKQIDRLTQQLRSIPKNLSSGAATNITGPQPKCGNPRRPRQDGRKAGAAANATAPANARKKSTTTKKNKKNKRGTSNA
jgi:hypothetical protein